MNIPSPTKVVKYKQKKKGQSISQALQDRISCCKLRHFHLVQLKSELHKLSSVRIGGLLNYAFASNNKAEHKQDL